MLPLKYLLWRTWNLQTGKVKIIIKKTSWWQPLQRMIPALQSYPDFLLANIMSKKKLQWMALYWIMRQERLTWHIVTRILQKSLTLLTGRTTARKRKWTLWKKRKILIVYWKVQYLPFVPRMILQEQTEKLFWKRILWLKNWQRIKKANWLLQQIYRLVLSIISRKLPQRLDLQRQMKHRSLHLSTKVQKRKKYHTPLLLRMNRQ